MIVAGTFVRGERYFDPRGRLIPEANYRKFDLPVLIEYGVTERLTLIAVPSFLDVAVARAPEALYRGAGYLDLGGRIRVWSAGAHVLSLQATARAPGARRAGNPAEAGWTDPETDLRALWGYGFTLFGWPAFLDTQAGYRFRAGGPADEARLDLTFGFRPTPRLLVLVQNFNTVAVSPNARPFAAHRAHKVAVGLAYTFGAWTFQVSGLATIAGQNALRERGVTTGFWYRF